MVVDAVLSLDQDDLDESLIGVKRIAGGGMQVSYSISAIEIKCLIWFKGLCISSRCFVQKDLHLRWGRATTQVFQ